MSQELFVSVNQLIEMSEIKGNRYDHVVIESSGISEPKSVRSVFQDAESYEVKLMDKVRVLYCTVLYGVSVYVCTAILLLSVGSSWCSFVFRFLCWEVLCGHGVALVVFRQSASQSVTRHACPWVCFVFFFVC